MDEQYSDLLWELPLWQSQARDWIHRQLQRLGIEIRGEITQPHLRPWSTVMHVPTGSGVLFFKASGPNFRSETGLTVYLAQKSPEFVPEVLAADTANGWMLMSDGGDRLRNVLAATKNVALWHDVLAQYAELQKEMAGCLTDLTALGLQDRSLARLPALYEGLLNQADDLGIGLPDCLTRAEYHWLCDFAPRFAGMCGELASFGIPETLQHDDLHDGNVLVKNRQTIVFDWGDSCISHPFFSLVVACRSAENTLGLDQSDPILLQFRQRYLDGWSRYAAPEKLDAALDLALKIGMVCRALTWQRVLPGLTAPFREQYLGYAGAWMQEFHHSLAETV